MWSLWTKSNTELKREDAQRTSLDRDADNLQTSVKMQIARHGTRGCPTDLPVDYFVSVLIPYYYSVYTTDVQCASLGPYAYSVFHVHM